MSGQPRTAAGRCVLASGNTGKLRELDALLAPLGVELVTQGALGVGEAEETGTTFVENAIIKARHAAQLTGLPAIADDSGIAVDALHGAPGVFSARYAGAGASDADNVGRLLTALAGVPAQARTARFHSVVVFMRHAGDPVPLIAHGEWPGFILDAPRGEGGFGYDPVFGVPERGGCSAAELDAADKNRLSHRGKALAALSAALAAALAAQPGQERGQDLAGGSGAGRG